MEGRRGGWPQICGLIRYKRGGVTIIDRRGLKQRSCECYGVSKREFDRLLGDERSQRASSNVRQLHWGDWHVASRKCIERGWPVQWKLNLPGRAVTLAMAVGMFALPPWHQRQPTRQRDSFGWVEHTNGVLRTVSALERRILEAESGERGYLLTGESGYLDSYNRSQARYSKTARGLRQAVSTIQVKSSAWTSCAPASNEEWPNSSRSSIRPDAFERCPGNSADGPVSAIEGAIEETLGQFRQAELALLGERQRRANRNTIVATSIASGDGRVGNAKRGDGRIPSQKSTLREPASRCKRGARAQPCPSAVDSRRPSRTRW